MSNSWWRRSGMSRKPAPKPASGTAVPSSDNRGFANWYRGLERPRGLVRFFKRSKDFVYYTAHGEDAVFVAKTFYRSTAVLSGSSDLPSVSVSVRLFSAIVAALLSEKKRVEVWELQNGRWQLCGRASPGSVEGILSDSVPLDGSDAAIDEASAEAVLMSVFSRAKSSTRWAGGNVGVAYASTAFRTLGFMQFEDSADLKVLESVTVQIGAKECMLESESGLATAALPLMEACGAMVLEQPRESFRGTPDEIVKDLSLLLSGNDESSNDAAAGSEKSALEADEAVPLDDGSKDGGSSGAEAAAAAAAAGMDEAFAALAALVRHLGLLDDPASHGTYSLALGHAERYMQYDSSVARAFDVFPAPRRSRTAVLLAQEPAEAAAATADGSGGPSEGGGGSGDEGGSAAAASAVILQSVEGGDLSLLGLVGAKCTGMGVRRLRWWLQHPLVDVAEIKTRQAVVSFLFENAGLRATLRDDATCMRGLVDLEAAGQKFVRKPPRATLSTMLVVYRATTRMDAVAKNIEEAALQDCGGGGSGGGAVIGGAQALVKRFAEPLRKHVKELGRFRALCEEVVDSDTMKRTNGRVVQVRPSFNEELSRLSDAIDEAAQGMQNVLKAATAAAGGASASGKVKLERSPVHGDHLRVTKKDQKLLAKIAGAQTLSVQKAGVLFTTDELKRLSLRASKLRKQYADSAAEVESQALEVAATYAHVVAAASQVLSDLDALLGLAAAAAEWNWCAPTLLPLGSQTFRLRGLRHPCVEASVGRSAFIPNDLTAEEGTRLVVVTGPNCGGKSTYIRSVGVVCLLAQIGSFVPAERAELSVVDRIMARVGASDNQLKGVSTFMAEMLDTSAILRCATRNSLVIIDELGRGTSSEDGFGIAWAVACRLARTGCVTLFATHFHELVALEDEPDVPAQNLHVTARADHGRLRMLYKVEAGGCDKSFGIDVARIAGFPASVVADAERLAAALEARQGGGSAAAGSGGGNGGGGGGSAGGSGCDSEEGGALASEERPEKRRKLLEGEGRAQERAAEEGAGEE